MIRRFDLSVQSVDIVETVAFLVIWDIVVDNWK